MFPDDSDDDQPIIITTTPEQLEEFDRQCLAETREFINSTSPYRLENWYPYVQQYTFRSSWTYITTLEAYSLSKIYHSNELNAVEQESIEKLKKRIGEALDKQFKQGCFMKLSTRSPKDYCWDFRDQQYFEQSRQNLVSKLRAMGLDKSDPFHPRELTDQQANEIYKFFCESTRTRIKITTPDDFIRIFSRSDRVVIDVSNLLICEGYLQRKFKEGDYSQGDRQLIKVCLREWVDFQWENQFRCFYFDYKITAISAYEQDCVFQRWINKNQQIRKRVLGFFQKLKPQLQKCGLDKGVVDLGFSNDHQTIWLIQINTFDENSRASLFSWKTERDTLQNGNAEVRVNTQYSPNIRSKISRIMGMIEKGSKQVVNAALSSCAPGILPLQ